MFLREGELTTKVAAPTFQRNPSFNWAKLTQRPGPWEPLVNRGCGGCRVKGRTGQRAQYTRVDLGKLLLGRVRKAVPLHPPHVPRGDP